MGREFTYVPMEEGVIVAGTSRCEWYCAEFAQGDRHAVTLATEPDNARDANAIQVLTEDGYPLGYIPANIAASIARARIADVCIADVVSVELADDRAVIVLDLSAPSTRVAAYRGITTTTEEEALAAWPEFHGKAFGAEPPTIRQFMYAVALGIDPNGLTFTSISNAIDRAKKREQKRRGPMPRDCELECIYDTMMLGTKPGVSPARKTVGNGFRKTPSPVGTLAGYEPKPWHIPVAIVAIIVVFFILLFLGVLVIAAGM